MCLIIYRPAGRELDEEKLLAAGRQNGDGLGVMWCRDGVIHTRRSMDVTKVFKFLAEAGDDVNLAIHFRWATHGTKDLSNCHPFRVTDNLYLMHNGVLPLYDKANQLSDTGVYARRVLRPILEATPDLWQSQQFQLLVDMSAGTSNKLLFLENDGGNGSFRIFNESLGTWHEGSWYSSGVPGKYKTYGSAYTGGYGGRYSNGYANDDEEWTGWQKTRSGHYVKKKEADTTSSEALAATSSQLALPAADKATEDSVPFAVGGKSDGGGSATAETSGGDATTKSGATLNDRLQAARTIADQFADSSLIPYEELVAWLKEEYEYDLNTDALITMGAAQLG